MCRPLLAASGRSGCIGVGDHTHPFSYQKGAYGTCTTGVQAVPRRGHCPVASAGSPLLTFFERHPPSAPTQWVANPPPIHTLRIPSSKGQQVCTPRSTNRHTHSAFMAPPPPSAAEHRTCDGPVDNSFGVPLDGTRRVCGQGISMFSRLQGRTVLCACAVRKVGYFGACGRTRNPYFVIPGASLLFENGWNISSPACGIGRLCVTFGRGPMRICMPIRASSCISPSSW